MLIDRRLLLKGAMVGAGALALPAFAQMVNARGFTHEVASGEPRADSVLLWTRYVPPAGASGRLQWEVARDAGFGRIVARGEALASPDHDFCVKATAGGLPANAWLFYRFVAESGQSSAIGRTRTLPEGPTARFSIGVFSCSNMPYGHFNAYGHAADRQDIDLLLHVGDYIYEYPAGTYASDIPGRMIEPAHEIVSLADYRLRYASYRMDPDLRRLHRHFPMVAMWDDHESANNSWQNGAGNHQPETEGAWDVRKAAAMQAYFEWLPVSDENWTRYRIGDLADLFRPETRLTGRTEQLDLATFLEGRTNVPAALGEFRDSRWLAPERTLLGMEQEAWLADGLRRSVADGVRWQVLGQQVIMGTLMLSQPLAALLGNSPNPQARQLVQVGLAAASVGLPVNLDMWDGYPAARARLLSAAQEADANLIVLSGDSHNAWAFDLEHNGAPAGVEMAVQAVSSPGYENYFPAPPSEVAAAVVADNPGLQWAETGRRGYLTLELTPEQVRGEWTFMKTVREPSTAVAMRHAMTARRGARRYAA